MDSNKRHTAPDFLATSRWTSPPMMAVAAVAYIVLKTVLRNMCGPDVGIIDAVALLPIALVAYRGGLLYGALIALATPVADACLSGLFTDMRPDTAISHMLRNIAVCETVVVIVGMTLARARRSKIEADAKADQCRRELYLLEKQNSIALEDAQSNTIRHRRDVDHYSSLVLLLHEAAEKLSGSLNTEELVETLFLVLDQSFRACRASVYFADSKTDTFRLFRYFEAERPSDPIGTMARPVDVISTTDPFLLRMAKVQSAVYVPREDLLKAAGPEYGSRRVDHDPKATPLADVEASMIDSLLSAPLQEKCQTIGIVNIHAMEVDRDFDLLRDLELLSMICNIASIALSNAQLFTKVQFLAERDSLTGIYNRRYFFGHLNAALKAMEESTATPFGMPDEKTDAPADETPAIALIMCDLDHFKKVNDNYGHQAGDAVLKYFVRLCAEHINENGLLARYGGEEFVITLTGGDIAAACETAERIRKALADKPFRYKNYDIPLSASMGVAIAPWHGGTVKAVLREADRALYTAKATGRNRVVRADESAFLALGAALED